MKNTLEKRILMFAFLILTLTIAVNAALNIGEFRRDYREGVVLRCESLAVGLQKWVHKVLLRGGSLRESGEIAARCRQIVDTDPEIAYCLIVSPSGMPLYSTAASAAFGLGGRIVSTLSKTVSIRRFASMGKVYDISQPIYGAGGKLVGRVRIGFPDSILTRRTITVLQHSMAVLGIAFLVVFALVVLFVKRDLVAPIGRLCSVAKEIAGGNFKVSMPPMGTREFAELVSALGGMAASLQERDEKIHLGYQELEGANQQLQSSYENEARIGAELGRSREMYRSLLEEASDAIMVSDESDAVILINKAAESFFGITRDQVVGRNIFAVLELLQSEDLDKQYGMYQSVRHGETWEDEVRFVRPGDQQPVVGWVRCSAVVGKDGSRLVQSIIRDVTREREIKKNLAESARELQRLNRMKDSFLGVASHELKTPLTVIVGYGDLLLLEMGDRLDPAVKAMLQHISDAAERLSGIVRDMVDVSMLDNRRARLVLRPAAINDLVRTAATELDYFLSHRQQNIDLRLDANLPQISCDPDRMAQALTNLLGNAIKFTPDGGSLAVETRLRTYQRPVSALRPGASLSTSVTEDQPQPCVEIVIQDTGIGISKIDQRHIFEKFFEAGNIEEHSTGKVAFRSRGTGLGLSIVKGIVDMHGGEIWVESPGYDPENCPGSTFHLLLPLTQPADPLVTV